MNARPVSFSRQGLYWSLAFVIGVQVSLDAEGQSKSKKKPAKSRPSPMAQADDTLTEWELINGAAIELRQKIAGQPHNEALHSQMAWLAIRSAIGAERALSIGNASLFDSYRRQFSEQFQDTRGRIQRMAEQGSRTSEYVLGILALHGFHEPASVESACGHFAAALAKGLPAAKYRASQCVESTDPARAASLLRDAAASGHPVAAEMTGRACLEAKPPDAQCAWDRLTFAAAAGRPTAQSLLGWMYAKGMGGRAADPARAARLYLQAAKTGDPAAQNNLAELYETGRGVPANLNQAFDWYRKAAEAGFPPAQFNLGRLYASGKGVARDFAEARKWLEKADSGGVATAKQALEWLDKNSAAK